MRLDGDSAGREPARLEHERRIAAGRGRRAIGSTSPSPCRPASRAQLVPTASHRTHRQHSGGPAQYHRAVDDRARRHACGFAATFLQRRSGAGRRAAGATHGHRCSLAHEDQFAGGGRPTPDIPIHKCPRGFDWPVHDTLLRDGALISEHVANAGSLAGRRAELLFLPLDIVGGDGAPACALGRVIRN